MSWLEQCRAMARYNRWMNEKVYAACATLSDEERKRDRGAFFKSIHGTLNHLMVGDSIWLGRFTKDFSHLPKDAEGKPVVITGLAHQLYGDFAELSRARIDLDTRIQAWVATLDEAQLALPFSYNTITVGPVTNPLWSTITHFFNHQTHHRGQITTLLSQQGVDVGATDLIMMLREERLRAESGVEQPGQP